MPKPEPTPKIVSQSFEIDYIDGATMIMANANPGERVVKIKTRSSKKLRDIGSILNDLQQTIQLCNTYLAVISQGDLPREIENALWMSALTVYVRCFTSDVRTGEKLDMHALDALDGGPHTAHAYFIDSGTSTSHTASTRTNKRRFSRLYPVPRECHGRSGPSVLVT